MVLCLGLLEARGLRFLAATDLVPAAWCYVQTNRVVVMVNHLNIPVLLLRPKIA